MMLLTHWPITGKQKREKRNKTKLKALLAIISNRKNTIALLLSIEI